MTTPPSTEPAPAPDAEAPWCWEPTGQKNNAWVIGTVMDDAGQYLSGQLEPGEGTVIEAIAEGEGPLSIPASICDQHNDRARAQERIGELPDAQARP